MGRILPIFILSVICSSLFGQQVADMIEYMPAPGQFINTASGSPSAAVKIGEEGGGLVSLGGFGGYIVFHFHEPVLNDPDNPFGVDFTIFGNAIPNWSEPGIVEVMKDENENGIPDDEWYEIAGSDYFFPATIKDYQVTYVNPGSAEASDVSWTDNYGDIGVIKKTPFQNQPYYPDAGLFPGIDPGIQEYTGSRIHPVLDFTNPAQTRSYPKRFGYADNHPRKDISDPLPNNPYTDEIENSGGDPVDIAWAIDSTGTYADLDRIDFIRIYTAVNNDGGVLGELSTEISRIVDVEPALTSVEQENLIAVPGFPPQVDPGEYSLDYSVFKLGRYVGSETVLWSVTEGDIAISENDLLILETPGKFSLIGELESDPSVNVTISSEVVLTNFYSRGTELPEVLYPNPAIDHVMINTPDLADIEILSMMGRRLAKWSSSGEMFRIDLRDFNSGMYVVRVRTQSSLNSYMLQIIK